MIPYLVRSGGPRKNGFSNSVSGFITGWKKTGLPLFRGVCFILLYLLVTGGPEEVVPLSLFPSLFLSLSLSLSLFSSSIYPLQKEIQAFIFN